MLMLIVTLMLMRRCVKLHAPCLSTNVFPLLMDEFAPSIFSVVQVLEVYFSFPQPLNLYTDVHALSNGFF